MSEMDLSLIRKNGIFLMTPCYGGQCTSGFANSVADLAIICGMQGIPFNKFFINNESLITRARNYCVDNFLNFSVKNGKEDFKFQHAIFIDADIEFNPLDVIRLAYYQSTQDLKVVCGNYPRKRISWYKIRESVKAGIADEDPDILGDLVGDFIFRTKDKNEIELGKPAEVVDAGTGFMMIHREVFEILDNKFPNLKYYPDHMTSDDFNGSRMISCYFDTCIDNNKRYLSEDYYFCALCNEAGIKIWTLPWISAIHQGSYQFRGNIPLMAKLGIPATTPPESFKG